jgi:hypothetical protein
LPLRECPRRHSRETNEVQEGLVLARNA